MIRSPFSNSLSTGKWWGLAALIPEATIGENGNSDSDPFRSSSITNSEANSFSVTPGFIL